MKTGGPKSEFPAILGWCETLLCMYKVTFIMQYVHFIKINQMNMYYIFTCAYYCSIQAGYKSRAVVCLLFSNTIFTNFLPAKICFKQVR
jgi:hypothetical protein